MTTTALFRFARGYAAVVGAMDFATGAGLLIAPAFTLACMGVSAPAADALAWVRFVGVFVGSVGASYLWAWRAAGPVQMRTMFIVMAFFRAAAGSYTGVAVALGTLEPAWLAVTFTDVACVAVQVWFIMKGVGRGD